MNASIDPSSYILDVTPLQTSFGDRGVGAYVRGLLEGLSSLGETVGTWGFAEGFGLNGSRPNRSVHRFGRGLWLSWPQLSAWGGRPLERGDIPHFTSLLASGVRVDRPYLATVYDFIPHRFPDEYLNTPWRRWLYQRYLRHLRGASHLLAISERVADEAAEFLGRDRGDVTVSLLGVPPLPQPSGQTSADPYLLVAGTPQPHKNLAFAVEVVSTLPEDRRLPVVVTGYPTDRRWEGLFELASRRGVRISHRGHVSRQVLADLYAGASAVLVPSRCEGFGLQVLEALSVGARVLCSDRGGLPEVASPAHVVPLDVDAWRQRVLAMLDGEAHDPCRARDWARSFSWERTARSTLDAYGRLA